MTQSDFKIKLACLLRRLRQNIEEDPGCRVQRMERWLAMETAIETLCTELKHDDESFSVFTFKSCIHADLARELLK